MKTYTKPALSRVGRFSTITQDTSPGVTWQKNGRKNDPSTHTPVKSQ